MGTRLRPAVAGQRRGTASALPLSREFAGPVLIRSASPSPGDAAEAFGTIMPGRKTKAGAGGDLKEATYGRAAPRKPYGSSRSHAKTNPHV